MLPPIASLLVFVVSLTCAPLQESSNLYIEPGNTTIKQCNKNICCQLKAVLHMLHLCMLHIEYPYHPFKIKEENNKHLVFDEVRKKWVVLTPEEWVRQNFIQYLIHVKKYPSSVIAIEKEIKLGELKKRCDIVVYKSHQPWMIVECKEQTLLLNDAVVQQILRYNIRLRVKILVVTNGQTTYAIELNNENIISLDVLPVWNEVADK